MRRDDFFTQVDDPFGAKAYTEFNGELIDSVRRGTDVGRDDVEVAVALAWLVHEEFEEYGTGGGNALTDEQMRLAVLALEAVVDRLGIEGFRLPFSDFRRFRSWWTRNDGYGSWQARRDLLDELFGELHERLAQLETRSIESTLADPITTHAHTGWRRVDEEISELRRHFARARSPQDYRSVGLICVAVTEALSAHCYRPDAHLRDGETEPPVANTKQRLQRFVEDAVPGRENQEIRKVARAVIEMAQAIKHRETPSRRDAGVAADSVIQLANIMRRLDEPA